MPDTAWGNIGSLIPTAQAIEVYRLTAEGFHLAATCAKGNTVETPLLPGFSLAVDSIFKP